MRDMQTVTNVLLDLEARNGVLRPADVVEFARPADSPLHGEFEWDDSVAAEKFRLVQAGRLIRVIEVKHVKPDVDPAVRRCKVFHNTSIKGESAYVSLERLESDEVRLQQARVRARNQLENVRREYEWLEDLPGLVREVFLSEPAA